MNSNRRSFLEVTGLSILGFGVTVVFDVFAFNSKEISNSYVTEDSKAVSAKHWGMVVDARRITSSELKDMFEACNRVHNIPNSLKAESHMIKWIWGEEFNHAFTDKHNKFLNNDLKHKLIPVLCNHCESPPCVRACPTKATFKRLNDGIVMMDFHRCIGCRFCMAACPFGARSFNFRDPRPFITNINANFPTRMKGVVEKCNFCAERLAIGKMPACVEASKGVLAFGDLNDSQSEVRELLEENYSIRRKQVLGTEPSVYYIV